MDDTIHGSYEGFAYVYDTFMDNVPYEEWAEYVTGILQEYGITDGLVLDLGCGTGSMTELLAEKGYDLNFTVRSGRSFVSVIPSIIWSQKRTFWRFSGWQTIIWIRAGSSCST